MTAQTSSSRIPQPQQPDEDFATLVARFRRARGLSQGQLAKAARLSRTYIYHLETGQRQAPSIRVARAVSRALELHGEDRQKLARAYLNLTGKQMEDEAEALDLLDQRELAAVLVRNMAFPAHSLDRLWNVSARNRAAMELFETDSTRLAAHGQNLLMMVFDPVYRARFRPWEAMARRLLAEFKYATRSLTYLPEYRTLWRSLRLMPDFTRIADTSDPGAGSAPGLIFQMRHSRLGPLTLRTTVTVFSGASDYSIVTYVPGDQQTLNTFAANGWQAPDQDLDE